MADTPSNPAEQDDEELKNALEAAFGPGAYDLISDADDSSDESQADFELNGAEFASDPVDPGQTAAAPLISESAGAADPLPIAREALPKPTDNGQSGDGKATLLLFELSEALFAVPIEGVIEIGAVPEMTPLVRGPDWLRGLANLRGSVIPVIDLQLRPDMPPESRSTAGQMIVVRPTDNSGPMGVVVDRVLGLRRLAPDAALADSRSAADSNRENDQGQPFTVLDLEEILLQGANIPLPA